MMVKTSESAGPNALAHTAIYEAVIRLLGDEARGKLLDIPAGEGALAQSLADLGFSVICCDLYPEMFKLPEIPISQGNLDEKLPFEDSEFDFIVCVEGLEHIERPANAIREFSRVLRPGGKLIVSVPNIMNIEERLKWLFFGYTSHFKPVSKQAAAEIYGRFNGKAEIGLHINPIGYSELRYLLEANGFDIRRVEMDKPKRASIAFWPLVKLIQLAGLLMPVEKRKSRWTDEINGPAVLTGGNTMIFEAVKDSKPETNEETISLR